MKNAGASTRTEKKKKGHDGKMKIQRGEKKKRGR